jgi:hypothetical protein
LDFDPDTSLCNQCLPGYRLSVDQRKCIDLSSQNCLISNNFECTQCAPNYFPKSFSSSSSISLANVPLSTSILLSSVSQETTKKLFIDHIQPLLIEKDFICQKSTVSNCSELKSLTECAQCVEPYVLDPTTATCKSPVFASIPFCVEYYGRGACAKCQDGYFKKSNDQCVSNFKIDFCEEYAQAYDGCVQCQDAYKLSANAANNSCVNRNEYPILNCGKNFLTKKHF